MIAFWQSPFIEGKQLFNYPLASVVTTTSAEADQLATAHQLSDHKAKLELTFDSAQAQMRLGLFADMAGFERMLRGDQRHTCTPSCGYCVLAGLDDDQGQENSP